MDALIDELLTLAWPNGVPARLDALIDRARCAELLQDFKLGLVFPFAGADRAVRLQLSAQGERAEWLQGVAAQWPTAALDRFVERAPPQTRLMVDSDGSERAELYLDDLQEVAHQLPAPQGLELMCATLELSTGTEQLLTRHDQPPVPRLPRMLQAGVEHLLYQGAVGLWALRWQDGEVRSVLWVTESRWRGNGATSRALVRSLGAHPGYDACLQSLGARDLEGYPDAVDLRADGAVDVTLGILDPAAPQGPPPETRPRC